MDDFPFDPSLRIPPLLDPQPLLSSKRGPTPLEPNARVNESSHSATIKLSSRSKALEEAKPIGDDDTYSSVSEVPRHNVVKPGALPEASRKRQKVDYFQLPKPTAKSKHNKPPPFKPVPVLNKLHQPPPSAALFPPITPNRPHDEDDEGEDYDRGTRSPSVRTQPQDHSQQAKPTPLNEAAKEGKGRARRVCLRARLKWTESETEALMKGVGIFGVGKWKKILNHPGLKFHPDRTMVDLKDRYRTCRMNEEKAIERQAASDGHEKREPAAEKKQSKARERGNSDAAVAETNDSAETKASTAPNSKSDIVSSVDGSSFSIFTPNNFNTKAVNDTRGKKPGISQPWTLEEDADLSKGYQKYGFQWTAIAKDRELCLNHRTGAQVRDRFRMKYPVVYQSSVPLPLPEIPKRPPRQRPERRSPTTQTSQDPTPLKKPSSLTFIINQPIKSTTKSPIRVPAALTLSSRIPQIGVSTGEGRPLTTPTIVDRFSGLDVQPLPDPGPEKNEDSDLESSDLTSSDDRSRQSTTEAEEARHLSSILGLLNDDAEQSSRLPPFKYPFDDEWSTGDSVTLPPLHWEELATRPMFDLE